MTTPLPTYATPTIAAVQPQPETWVEIRCPGCRQLGYTNSAVRGLMYPRLLITAHGLITPQTFTVEIKCDRCHTLVSWIPGTPKIEIVKLGRENHRRQTAAFE